MSRYPPSWHMGTGVLLAHSVITQLLTFVLRPAMTYRAIELHTPGAALGLLAASFAMAPLFLAIPAGRLVDRTGERRVMVGGALLLTLTCLTFITFGGTVGGLFIGGLMLGTGHLCSVIGQQSMVANTTARGSYDTAFGRYTFAASLGQAAGPGLIIVFGGEQGIPDTEAIYLWSTAVSGVLLVLSMLIPARTVTTRTARETSGMGALLRMPGLVRALATSCVVLAAVDVTLAYLPALGAERGLSSGAVGALLSLRGFASMASRLFLGRLTLALGRRRVLVVSTLGAAVAMAALALPVPLWALAALLLLVGAGLGVGQPITMSWLAESAPAGARGRAMSLRLVGNRTGQIIVPGAAGLLAAGLGAGGVLCATAIGLGWAGLAARHLPHRSSPTD